MKDQLSAPDEQPKPPISVGEEFVQWAEQHWKIADRFNYNDDPMSESSSWDHTRNIFVNKINAILAERLSYIK